MAGGQVGRPKGGKKFGGRAKGTPNRNTLAVRERIAKEGDPIGFLISVLKGKTITAGTAKFKVTETPTVDQRSNAARILVGKIVPDLKAIEVSGTDGGPIGVRVEDARTKLLERLAQIASN
jgi:hypothetical protein